MFAILGLICIGFGFVDYFGYLLFDVDLTGVSWSPAVAGVLGSVMLRMGSEQT